MNTKTRTSFFRISILIPSLIAFSAHAEIVDTYLNFKELSRHEKGVNACGKGLALALPEKITYCINAVTRSYATTTVFAIHAGNLEVGTGELTEAIAAEDLNYYIFEILEAKQPKRLHLTSAHFDEPQALALAQKSENCISIHGFAANPTLFEIIVGGGNSSLKEKFLSMKPPFGIKTVAAGDRLTGASNENIVNRCKNHGLQLELSQALRDRAKTDLSFRKEVAHWIRSVLAP